MDLPSAATSSIVTCSNTGSRFLLPTFLGKNNEVDGIILLYRAK